MTFEVKGKVALITGGVEGIGYAITRSFLKNEIRGLAIADINVTKGLEVFAKLNNEFGDRVIFIKTNVADKDQLENAFKKTIEHFKNLDIVVNNAGIINEEKWETMIDINFTATIRGTILAVETYLPKYKSGSEGVVVNVSSIAILNPPGAIPVYSATKFGVLGLSAAYGKEYIHKKFGVKVVTVCPGSTATQIIDADRCKFRFKEIWDDAVKKGSPWQEPEFMGDAVLKIINKGPNGSVYLVDNYEISQLKLYTEQDMKIGILE